MAGSRGVALSTSIPRCGYRLNVGHTMDRGRRASGQPRMMQQGETGDGRLACSSPWDACNQTMVAMYPRKSTSSSGLGGWVWLATARQNAPFARRTGESCHGGSFVTRAAIVRTSVPVAGSVRNHGMGYTLASA